MTFAVVVKVDGTMLEWEERPADELAALQEAVASPQQAARGHRGLIELVRLQYGACGFINEEGKIHGLDVNPLATDLYWKGGGDEERKVRRRDYIAGDMVVLGGPDNVGESTAIPELMLQTLRAVAPV